MHCSDLHFCTELYCTEHYQVFARQHCMEQKDTTFVIYCEPIHIEQGDSMETMLVLIASLDAMQHKLQKLLQVLPHWHKLRNITIIFQK